MLRKATHVRGPDRAPKRTYGTQTCQHIGCQQVVSGYPTRYCAEHARQSYLESKRAYQRRGGGQTDALQVQQAIRRREHPSGRDRAMAQAYQQEADKLPPQREGFCSACRVLRATVGGMCYDCAEEHHV